MGVRKTADFLEKATWSFAGVLLVLSFVAVLALPKGGVKEAEIDKGLINIPTQSQQTPNFPIPNDGEQGNNDIE
jgi:preprotein translocase subunit SecG